MGETQIEGVWVPDKLQEGGGGVSGTYLIPAQPKPISHSFLHSLPSKTSHLQPVMPQERLSTSHVHSRCVVVE